MKHSWGWIWVAVLGVPIAGVGLLIATIRLGWRTPVRQADVHRLAVRTQPRIQREAVRGGGYYFGLEAQDIWIRIVLETGEPFSSTEGRMTCARADLDTIRQWFGERIRPQGLERLWLDPNQVNLDQRALGDSAQLQCRVIVPLGSPQSSSSPHRFGQSPRDCNLDWQLYHPPSRLYYRRVACSH